MKKLVRSSGLVFLILLSACGGGSDDDTINSSNLGSFEGSLQVADDPQTDLGYIFNSTADFKRVGDRFTMTINGDDGFNRSYEGKIDSEANNSTFIMSLEMQTAPIEKIAAGTLTIGGNSSSIDIGLANDTVLLKEKENDTVTFELTGKLRILGSFIKSE